MRIAPKASIITAMNKVDKVKFASADWLDRARVELEDLVAAHGEPGVRFCLCEVFTDCPTDIDPLAAAALTDICLALFNSNEFLYID